MLLSTCSYEQYISAMFSSISQLEDVQSWGASVPLSTLSV